MCWLPLNPSTVLVCGSSPPPPAPHAAHLHVGGSPNFLPPGDSFAVNLSDGKCKLLARACCVFLDAFFSCSLRGQLLSFPTILSAVGRNTFSLCRERGLELELISPTWLLSVSLTRLQYPSVCRSFQRLLLCCCLYKAGLIKTRVYMESLL